MVDVNKTPSNVLPLHLKQTFPPMIWIFTEGEGDGIKSKLLLKFFLLYKTMRTQAIQVQGYIFIIIIKYIYEKYIPYFP